MENVTTPFKDINAYTSVIKSKSGNKIFTNYFKQELSSISFTIKGEHSILFQEKDAEVQRLYFFSSDLSELSHLFKELPYTPIVIDYYSKTYLEEVESLFLNSGFTRYATFERMVNEKFWIPKSKSEIIFALQEDKNELYEKLHTDFDKFVDHIPNEKELNNFIENEWVLLNKVNHNITGYLVYEIQKNRASIRALISTKDDIPLGSMVLLRQLSSLLSGKNVKMAYGWTNLENEKALTILTRFRYEFSGLRDYIYVRE